MFYYQPSDETTGFVLWWPNSVDWYSTKLQPRSGAFPLKVGGKRQKPWERGCLNYWKSTVAKTKLNIIINFLSSGFYHLQGSCHLSFAFSISIFLSAFYHPHFIICILSSAFLIIRILQSPSAFSRVTFCGRCAQARMERDRSVRFRMLWKGPIMHLNPHWNGSQTPVNCWNHGTFRARASYSRCSRCSRPTNMVDFESVCAGKCEHRHGWRFYTAFEIPMDVVIKKVSFALN